MIIFRHLFFWIFRSQVKYITYILYTFANLFTIKPLGTEKRTKDILVLDVTFTLPVLLCVCSMRVSECKTFFVRPMPSSGLLKSVVDIDD